MNALITFATLANQQPRTLLYGLATNANGDGDECDQYLHVYVEPALRLIVGVLYTSHGSARFLREAFDERVLECNEDYIAAGDGKRFVFAEVDAEMFARLMKAGLVLNLGAVCTRDYSGAFAGLRQEQFTPHQVADARMHFCARFPRCTH